jgi:hypothetical protein
VSEDNVVPGEGWEHGRTIVNLVKYKYQRLYGDAFTEEGLPIPDATDGIQTQDIEVQWVATADGFIPEKVFSPENLAQLSDSIKKYGQREITYDAKCFGVVHSLNEDFDPTQELPHLLSQEIAKLTFPRYAFGCPVIRILAFRNDHLIPGTGRERVGNWVRTSLPWFPDYATLRRGVQRWAQIVGINDSNCEHQTLVLELDELLDFARGGAHVGLGAYSRLIVTAPASFMSVGFGVACSVEAIAAALVAVPHAGFGARLTGVTTTTVNVKSNIGFGAYHKSTSTPTPSASSAYGWGNIGWGGPR